MTDDHLGPLMGPKWPGQKAGGYGGRDPPIKRIPPWATIAPQTSFPAEVGFSPTSVIGHNLFSFLFLTRVKKRMEKRLAGETLKG